MSTTPNPVVAAPAPKLTSIQRIEAELATWMQQEAQAIANLNSLRGAIQGAQHLLGILKAEAAKAEAEAQKLITEALAETKTVVNDLKSEVEKGIHAVENAEKKL